MIEIEEIREKIREARRNKKDALKHDHFGKVSFYTGKEDAFEEIERMIIDKLIEQVKEDRNILEEILKQEEE